MDGKESVLAKFEANKSALTHWKIYYDYVAVESKLCETSEYHVGELDAELSRKKLGEAIDRLEPGDYLIQFKSAPSASAKIVSHRFKIGYVPNQQNQNFNPDIKGFLSPDHVEAIIASKLAARDLTDMQKQIDEIKKSKVTAWKDIMDGLKELAPVIQGLLSQGPQVEPRPIRIMGPALNTEEQQDAQARRAYFLKLSNEATAGLYDAEDFGEMAPGEHGIVLLWAMNEYRKANPDMFKLLKPKLLEFATQLEAQ